MPPQKQPPIDGSTDYDNDKIYDNHTFSRKSTIILDSSAYPTHHIPPLPSTPKLHKPSYTTTATGDPTETTNSGTIQVNNCHQPCLLTTVVITPHIQNMLLAVRSITGRHRAVVFTAHNGYIVQPVDIKPKLLHREPFTTWTSNGYEVNGHITEPTQPPRKTMEKATHIRLTSQQNM